MSEWIATRGTTASGPLTPPPGRRDCRTWQEDQILARLVTSPSDAPLITATVPPGTFTTDVRYDIYQAIAAVRDLRSYTPDDISAELARRMTAVPAHGLARYGGAAAPLARAYLARLTETLVDHDTAVSVASILAQEDTHYRSMTAARGSRPSNRRLPGRHHARPGRCYAVGPADGLAAARTTGPRSFPCPTAVALATGAERRLGGKDLGG
jgi:hypothetical protein